MPMERLNRQRKPTYIVIIMGFGTTTCSTYVVEFLIQHSRIYFTQPKPEFDMGIFFRTRLLFIIL